MENYINTGAERIPLNELSQLKIVSILDDVNDIPRTTLIPIGFPAAGKSMFLSSLMHYCVEYQNKNWVEEPELNYPFDRGRMSKDLMVKFFKEKKGISSTPSGTIDLIGLTMNPIKKLPKLNLAFIDLAGDDLEKFFDPTMQTDFQEKIEAILNGCITGEPVFCLITPYKPKDGDSREDDLHSWFINYIKQNMPNLFKIAKFIVVVTQWDKVEQEGLKLTVEEYIKKKRPKLNGLINHREYNVFFTDYSVGLVKNLKDENGNESVYIQKIDFDYPDRFWNKLYEFRKGKNLNGLSGFSLFFKKLFGS